MYLKIEVSAMRARRLPWCFALLLVGASAAHAVPVLSVVDPATNGVVAGFGSSPLVFAPATENPARANASDGVRAVMRQNGAQLIISLDIEDTLPSTLASTGPGSPHPFFGAIPIQILGTAGEANGTLVSLAVAPSTVSLQGDSSVVQQLNGVAHDIEQPFAVADLKVGDTFEYWLTLSANNSTGSVIVILSVALPGSPAPLGESGPWALLGAAGLAALVARIRAGDRRLTGG